MNLNYQLQPEITNFNYLMDNIMYQIFQIIWSI